MQQQNSIASLDDSEASGHSKDTQANQSLIIKKTQITQPGQANKLNNSVALNMQMGQHNQEQSPKKARRNSRNINKNSVVINGSNKNEFLFSPVGGPEIAQSLNQSIDIQQHTERIKIPSSLKNGNDLVKQQVLKIQKNPTLQNSLEGTINVNTQAMNTIRNTQNIGNIINNYKSNGSARNLQNFRTKRIGKEQQAQGDSQVRAPPIQNGLYFSNIAQNHVYAPNQRYQQAPTIVPSSIKNNGTHQKVQSLDVSNIFKNIINGQQPNNNSQIPQIANVNSPKNGGSFSNSIEKINKNISESISKGNIKEFQLIQAYQQQKYKEQLTQRKNKQGIKSLDFSSEANVSMVQQIGKDQFASAKNSNNNQQIQFSQNVISQKVNIGNQQRSRIIGGGSLSSRLQQDALTQESSTFSSTLDDEFRNQKSQIKFPISSAEGFKILSPYLWDYEKTEILEFDTIYFFNVNERKRQVSQQRQSGVVQQMGTDSSGQFNYGFDNENQEYNVVMHEHLAYRYEIVKKLGKGSFGIVLRAFDHKTKDFYALKILKNKKRLYKQGLVEANLIETLNRSDPDDKKNIIRKHDQFVFRKHLMITFEMLSINLYEFIKMNNFQGFSLNLIKRFAIQILISLFFLKEHNIVHCDMKPENILLRKINKSGIKIIDFGSGCFENEKIYTYIQSRFYRAPEIVLGIAYTTAIDMWSYGCILYELYIGYPLFPGEDEKEHMAMIMEVKGIPPRSVLARATRRKVFFDEDYQPLLVPNSRGKIRQPNTKTLQTLMNCPDRDFVDFIDVTFPNFNPNLQRCIEWKVENRMTPEQAFSHPFIAKAVQELKGMRGQSETQKQPQSNTINNPQQKQKELASISETVLPHINSKP